MPLMQASACFYTEQDLLLTVQQLSFIYAQYEGGQYENPYPRITGVCRGPRLFPIRLREQGNSRHSRRRGTWRRCGPCRQRRQHMGYRRRRSAWRRHRQQSVGLAKPSRQIATGDAAVSGCVAPNRGLQAQCLIAVLFSQSQRQFRSGCGRKRRAASITSCNSTGSLYGSSSSVSLRFNSFCQRRSSFT
jgi:hypothetical protein